MVILSCVIAKYKNVYLHAVPVYLSTAASVMLD